jgi:hypothetical protein
MQAEVASSAASTTLPTLALAWLARTLRRGGPTLAVRYLAAISIAAINEWLPRHLNTG